MPLSHELIGLAVLVLFQALVWSDLQHRKTTAMSQLSDKITALDASVANLAAAVTAATANVATPADLAALDAVTQQLDGITASLTAPAV